MRDTRVAWAATGFVLLLAPLLGRADDKAERPGVTIAFCDTAEVPKVTYNVSIVIEYIDAGKPVALVFSTPAGSKGFSQAAALSGWMMFNESWDHTLKDNTVVVRSWKDPKTGTTHAVRTVTVTSPDMPKAELPRVTPSGQKG
jgi:hypothetical protein